MPRMRTSLLIRMLDSGKLINRNLQDIFVYKVPHNFPNLYTPTDESIHWVAREKEANAGLEEAEDFGVVPALEILPTALKVGKMVDAEEREKFEDKTPEFNPPILRRSERIRENQEAHESPQAKPALRRSARLQKAKKPSKTD